MGFVWINKVSPLMTVPLQMSRGGSSPEKRKEGWRWYGTSAANQWQATATPYRQMVDCDDLALLIHFGLSLHCSMRWHGVQNFFAMAVQLTC